MKEVLSFYTPYASIERMENALHSVLHEQVKAYRHTASTIDIELYHQEYIRIQYVNDLDNNEIFKTQIQRLYQSIQKKPCENIHIRQNLLYQVALFHGAYVFEFNYNEHQRDEKILPLMEIADFMDALIFWETGDISDSYGDVLLSKKGKNEVNVFNPVDGFDITNKSLGLSDMQLKRMHHSIRILRYKGIYAPNNIAPPYDEQCYIFQEIDDILKRCIACMVMAIYTDYFVRHNQKANEAYAYVEKIIMMYRCTPYFTSAEIDFLNNLKPVRSEIDKYQGYYECCYTMLWSLNFFDTLYFPSALCCDSLVVRTLFNYDSLKSMIAQAKRRSKSEILDAQDVVQRFVWGCADAKKLNFTMPGNLAENIVQLRYQTLYWIANKTYYSWDEVPCNIVPLSSVVSVVF